MADDDPNRGPGSGAVGAPPAPPVGMRDGVPDERIVSRELTVVTGVEVARHRFLPGETAYPPLGGHLVNLHLGPPTQVVTRRDGVAWEGRQRNGDVEVFAAGRATESVLRDPSDDVSVLIEEAFFRRTVDAIGADPARIELLDRFATRDPRIERILLSFVPEFETGGLGGELYAQALATALAVHLVRDHSSLGPQLGRAISPESGRGLPPRALARVADYVEANLAAGLSLDAVAAVANLSPRHFLRLFKHSTGLSPHQYVIRARVERAKGLLAGGDLSLAGVATACGFAHQQHLSRHFTRMVGVSPGRYRRLATR